MAANERSKANLVPGRKPGTKVKKTVLKEAILAVGGDVAKADPMAYLASLLADDKLAMETRMQAASILMPYYHSKKPVISKVDADIRTKVLFDADTAKRMAQAMLAEDDD